MDLAPIGPPRPNSVKHRNATPLEPGALVSVSDYRTLRALSVDTVEELIGLIAADADAVAQYLPDIDLPQVQADAGSLARSSLLADFGRLEYADYELGALAPRDIEVEDRASPDYVESWIEGAANEPDEYEDDLPPEVNLLRCFGPVRDQAQRGTCVAQAVCALLECQRSRLHSVREDLSEQFVYWHAKAHDGLPDQEGTWLRVAMPGAESAGACHEDVWGYNSTPIAGNEGQGPPPEGASEDALTRLLEGAADLTRRDVAAMRASLDDGRPVAIAVPVYNNWYSNPAANALGLIPMPFPNSTMRGGHAMCVTGYGYDSDFPGGGYFIVRNSWGTTWATQSPIQAGYGAIPFLYVEKYGWEAWTAK